jgi:hypothetical protein
MRVTIDDDLGSSPRPGIVRVIPDQYHFDELHDRRYPIDQINVQRNNVTEPFVVQDSDGPTTVTIGDPDRPVSGSHGSGIA